MPLATFLVKVEIPVTDPATLEAVASEIEAELQGALPVQEVTPWARHDASTGSIPGLLEQQSLLRSSLLNPQTPGSNE